MSPITRSGFPSSENKTQRPDVSSVVKIDEQGSALKVVQNGTSRSRTFGAEAKSPQGGNSFPRHREVLKMTR